ncbi:AIPR family protein [Listeria seeligeri]|uniref:AIPR family protein n=1 Tax=Listeria seeligeri TaxID=1640 RepID=UPI0016257745|nr:AIPR family protein [Listeria seeligeri]MBC1527267.1 AIPR family protein [Listeria seeligeri]MBC1726141.1 AIPR family protein [Listeria seeligeri]MBC1942635.1 AIPR family protein [Listeria seeligeri]MBF2673112.1 AIPR family protein [Listeria seeligeri]
MATINDFKTVNVKSREYSKYVNLSEEQRKINGSRFGFYLLALECITNIKDVDVLLEMIIDTDFRSIVFDEKNDDLGVDAVNIDEEERVIQLFNFKYREKFKINKGQELGDMIDVTKFLVRISSEELEGTTQITKDKLEKIIVALNSDDIWKIELYMVSNENIGLSIENPTVNQFKQNYGMKVGTIVLDDIVSYISEFPEDLSAKFMVDSTSVMTYEIDELSSSKSYLIKLPLIELIRITCKDEQFRNNINVDYSKLQGQKIEMSLLFDNVRGYLGATTKFNSNIISTIEEQPNKFFMFNNGITMTAKNISAGDKNGNKKFECTISGFQIVNGGQTLRTIYEYSEKDFNEENLANAEVLIRLFQTETDKELTNDIAEYTNSQNAISSIDLKSISNYQIQIGTYLEANGILYVRKSGDTGKKDKDYPLRISMEKTAQLIYSYQGYPDRATNQKKALFEKYYDEIFDVENLDFEVLVSLIIKYYEVENIFSETDYKGSHQKILYVIYLMEKMPGKSIIEYIELLESYLMTYKKDEDLSPARKLIQKGFKDFIESSND